MTKLSQDEVQQFLSEREHLARIGTVDSDGMPRVLPLWFIIQGDELLFTPRSLAIIWKNIERDPRVGISIDEETMPMRKVSILKGMWSSSINQVTMKHGVRCTAILQSAMCLMILQMDTLTGPMTSRAHCVRYRSQHRQQKLLRGGCQCRVKILVGYGPNVISYLAPNGQITKTSQTTHALPAHLRVRQGL